jgi:hypothetical protein
MLIKNDKSSFRDPDGFVFRYRGILLRQINLRYKDNYDHLINSGLYDLLVNKELLIPHKAVSKKYAVNNSAYKVIRPKLVPFVSYPYSWSFSQLKDAGLLTLKIQEESLKAGMILKDANAYNIQFIGVEPVFIDTLSFKKYEQGEVWLAYKQFCQQFLVPLSLMAYRDLRLNNMLKVYLDGIPLDMGSKLLPPKTYFKAGILSHIHLHARSQVRFSGKRISPEKYKIGKHSLLALIDNLEKTVRDIKLPKVKTEWGDYYESTNYSQKAFNRKGRIVKKYVKIANPNIVWDLGANEGEFTRLVVGNAMYAISADIDPLAVEKNYLISKKEKRKNILPLIWDLTNPPPSIGWANAERSSFTQRGKPDLVLALALIHHLVITNNLPLEKVARFFFRLTKYLIIEFVPKKDSNAQKMLASREDIFDNYTKDIFEKVFGKYFETLKKDNITGSKRIMYLMKRKRDGKIAT